MRGSRGLPLPGCSGKRSGWIPFPPPTRSLWTAAIPRLHANLSRQKFLMDLYSKASDLETEAGVPSSAAHAW